MTSSYIYQLIVCFVFLLALYIISKIITKKLPITQKSFGNKNIQVLEKQHIGKNAMLMLVKVNNETLLLGVTNQKISLIKNISDQSQYEN